MEMQRKKHEKCKGKQGKQSIEGEGEREQKEKRAKESGRKAESRNRARQRVGKEPEPAAFGYTRRMRNAVAAAGDLRVELRRLTAHLCMLMSHVVSCRSAAR